MLSTSPPDAARTQAREKAARRFAHLNNHLELREVPLDHFTVADAYLVTVLNWARFVGLDLAKWPAVRSYFDRMTARPILAKALAEEMAMFQEQQARRTTNQRWRVGLVVRMAARGCRLHGFHRRWLNNALEENNGPKLSPNQRRVTYENTAQGSSYSYQSVDSRMRYFRELALRLSSHQRVYRLGPASDVQFLSR